VQVAVPVACDVHPIGLIERPAQIVTGIDSHRWGGGARAAWTGLNQCHSGIYMPTGSECAGLTVALV